MGMMTRTHTRMQALAFGAGALFVAARPSCAQSEPKIRMGAVATETFAEPLYAQGYGAFSRAGLNVDVALFASGGGVNEAMSGGALDVAACDPIQLTNAINHGIPYRYFAGGLLHDSDAPTTVLCVKKNGPIKAAQDLEGQAVGIVELHDLAEFSIREWMKKEGADSTKARFIELTGPSMQAAIERGTVAAAMMIEPYLSMSSAEVRVLADTYDSVASRFILNGFYARRDWLAQNADAAKKLTAALYDAARWVNTHRSESLPILVKHGKFKADKLAGVRRATYATALSPVLIQPVIDIAGEYKAVNQILPVSELIAKI